MSIWGRRLIVISHSLVYSRISFVYFVVGHTFLGHTVPKLFLQYYINNFDEYLVIASQPYINFKIRSCYLLVLVALEPF